MNMQPKTNAAKLKLIEKLAGELARLGELLADQAGVKPDSPEVMVIAKLARGLDPSDWQALCERNNLQGWLGMPLESGAAGSASALADVLEELIYQRDHDPLTGLANRRRFDSYLAQELARAARSSTHLSLVLLDLDNFKFINDTYGHPCGDAVLRELGRFLKEGHRSFDLVARTGGDEFAVILPGSSCWNTQNMLVRLAGRLSSKIFVCDNSPEMNVKFSGGVAGVGPELGYVNADELVKMADEALYDAKNKGKNQICISGSVPERQAETMVLSHEKKFLFSQ